jgi:hypothetical protein
LNKIRSIDSDAHTNTHTHTHTHTHIHTHTHPHHTHTLLYTHTHSLSNTHIHSLSQTHIRTYKHIFRRVNVWSSNTSSWWGGGLNLILKLLFINMLSFSIGNIIELENSIKLRLNRFCSIQLVSKIAYF